MDLPRDRSTGMRNQGVVASVIPAPPPPPPSSTATTGTTSVQTTHMSHTPHVPHSTQITHPFRTTAKDKLVAPLEDKVVKEEAFDVNLLNELKQNTLRANKHFAKIVKKKFKVALSDDSVWQEGLLNFYDIYKYLENNLSSDLLPIELHRTAAIESDLNYFYGENWRSTYRMKDCAFRYLRQLDDARSKGAVFLFAYAFQMYMGLMSQGQILQKERMIKRKLWELRQPSNEPATSNANDSTNNTTDQFVQIDFCPNGCAFTYFPSKIPSLQKKFKVIFTKVYSQLDDNARKQFIDETRLAFAYNTEILKSISGDKAKRNRKFLIAVTIILGIFAVAAYTQRIQPTLQTQEIV